jgi:hypothetical protein
LVKECGGSTIIRGFKFVRGIVKLGCPWSEVIVTVFLGDGTLFEAFMTKTNLLEIPGIGKTFVKDFARIDIHSISDLADRLKRPFVLVGSMASQNAFQELRKLSDSHHVGRVATGPN